MHNKIESEIELFGALANKKLSDFCDNKKYKWKTEQHFGRSVFIPVKKDKKTEKTSVKSNLSVSNYVKNFIEGNLENFLEDSIFYNYKTQFDIGLPKLYEKYKLFGKKFYLSSFDFQDNKEFLFLHLISSLEYQDILEIYDLEYLGEKGGENNLGYGFKATINLLDKFFEKYEARLRLIEPQLEALEKGLEKGLQEERIAENVVKKMQAKTDVFQGNDRYEILARDREIWVNETYLISKPHAIGSNLEFFLYLLDNPNKMIKRNELPQGIKDEIGKKRFIVILNALGFKGEILKLFFPKRGKTRLLFNQIVSKSELDNRGIKERILLQELGLAHSKNSPE